jgi:hypothetical protein
MSARCRRDSFARPPKATPIKHFQGSNFFLEESNQNYQRRMPVGIYSPHSADAIL